MLRREANAFRAEDTEATNELINDGQFVQPLTGIEIEALKQSGVHASVQMFPGIGLFGISHQIAGHHQ